MWLGVKSIFCLSQCVWNAVSKYLHRYDVEIGPLLKEIDGHERKKKTYTGIHTYAHGVMFE